MRVATVVLGIALTFAGGTSSASEPVGSVKGAYAPASFGEGSFVPAPASALLLAQDGGLRNGGGVMGFVPSQSSPTFGRSPLMPAEFLSQDRPYNPATTPLPTTRTVEDHLLTGLVALMLIAYQLRRKHRFLRPHQFST